jgi:secondary thiamine-phosphate synthase enzyme
MVAVVTVKTPAHSAMVDITRSIAEKVLASGVQEGYCIVYVPHTTAGITINEGSDPDVVVDILASLDKLIPWKAAYRHSEGNSAAHIKAALMGGSVHVIVQGGQLVLGTWERVFFCEFDGPRTRKVHIKIVNG